MRSIIFAERGLATREGPAAPLKTIFLASEALHVRLPKPASCFGQPVSSKNRLLWANEAVNTTD